MKKSDIKKSKVIHKQLQDIEKKESKILYKNELKFVSEKISPVQEKIESKIPKKLQLTLENAFEASFKLIFEKGLGIIEKSYSKEERHIAFDIHHYTILKQTTHKNIRRMDQAAKKGTLLNQLVTTAEGGILGALGIGLPDIPLLIGMILKNIYEMSLSYGFDYTSDREKLYILYLICAGVTKGEIKVGYSKQLDDLAQEKSYLEMTSLQIEKAIKEAAQRLAESMLMAKFIQGLPLVGVVGGICNYTMMKEISQMSQIKYKKRYLKQLLD